MSLCHHRLLSEDCSICAARRRIEERKVAQQKEIGFRPSFECPVCHGVHAVEFELHGIPMLACSSVENNQLFAFDGKELKCMGVLSVDSKEKIEAHFKRQLRVVK